MLHQEISGNPGGNLEEMDRVRNLIANTKNSIISSNQN
jgi:hypothetical protein